VNADGSFSYTPDVTCGADSDSFTYTVSDGHGGTATAAVTVAIDHYTGVSLAGGVLRVGGGAGTDVVVFLDGRLWVNGTPYCLTGVTEVRVWGRGGDDLIELTGLTVPAFVSGGSGNDAIVGGSGDDVLLGGSGDDVVLGGGGDDVLLGGAGRDRLVGGAGNDVLIGGDYWEPAGLAALRALGAAWAAGRDSSGYDSTADDLATDTATDKLTGSSGADWFIISVGDVVTDLPGVQQHDGDLITYRS
jgi:Ca2+-binding RTX toxin-like protein